MKTRVKIYALVLCSLLLLAACGAGKEYQNITAAEGKALLDGSEVFTLIDARTANEYETAHIPSAINISSEAIENISQDTKTTIVVYSDSVEHSKEVADKLVEKGYKDVKDMGSFENWPYYTIAGKEPGKYIKQGVMGSFVAKDIDGEDVDQSIFADYNLTMVNVWATYCGPCLSEMPELGELADEYKNKGVRIVGLVSDTLNYNGTVSESQVATARSIVKQTGANYTHIIPSQDLFGLMSQITAVPTTFFVDSTGSQVGKAYLGSRDKAAWNEIIVQILKEIQK